ncbi:MAG: hypothetical protein LBD29_04905, partial [Treponema sp.]|nr:hypothetical protein [Treponema sp.]
MANDIFVEENYTKEEVIINIFWANIFGLFVLAAAIILFGIPFYLIWHEKYQNVRFFDFSMNLQQRYINIFI